MFREEPFNPANSERMRVTTVDAKGRHQPVQQGAPRRVQIDREKQDAPGFKHTMNFLHYNDQGPGHRRRDCLVAVSLEVGWVLCTHL